MPEFKPEIETFAKIKVVGVGGGGGAAINRMIASEVKGVEYIAVNTDLQALQNSLAQQKIHVGRTTTRGLGAGMDPSLGRKSAEESQNEIREMLKGTDLLFITCGLGGGTGTGVSPVIAEISREMGILTIAVVTKPFSFEGGPRRRIAEEGLKDLSSKVDTLITIPNDRIWQIIDKKTPLIEAFRVVDEVLRQGVQGISELITLPGLINVDFADVRAIMKSSGSALMGMGIASGDNRAIEAAKAAVSSPLLEISVEGAKGILFTIAGGENLTMYEVSEAAKIITESVDPDAKIIFGAVNDEKLKDNIKITVVATGFDEKITKDNLLKVNHEPVNYFQARPEDDDVKHDDDVTNNPFSAPAISEVPVSSSRSMREPSQVRPSAKPIQREPESTDSDDDELDIPAFIRKKMM
ncbi:cell division protein FtsZ [Candidatus Falkowbacteria bacterium RIFOXYD2_FULL_35_9]|uniref:Cell division protein FtsZ n=1 Tax=Candidatus Falkowbacteria bacterium RIFOXYC2_FULL_36_12 TaxID=1798002 RepID=A0A1F5SZ03_9BACT|nr:MAG: cell division protein FtsZ [Candidatus Falkowbacteria bacterium RIFOXYB2_FULL_35_7]OGF31872.1 MAG: cell division protein FtsZ [Candidatus Falkowbacteria bacterium RIFOXYC2_FULL_36_12]OGF33631.1 MAG: cell division protein FtsZ [Candidatus Falkowbacteria bacterium RIFOXYA2_FULL_35_8]OGF45824.1 MAG: cell division protein FtsZ [Candidatus Falkowbacteria bacterium RIFOXYD2_FULL_35_9]